MLKDLILWSPRATVGCRSPRRPPWSRPPPTSRLSIDDLVRHEQVLVLVTAWHIAMYLCRELTDMSLPKIGQQFGGRDHTTVINADRKIRSLMAERRSTYTQSHGAHQPHQAAGTWAN